MNTASHTIPDGYDRGVEMQRQLNIAHGAAADLRLATAMTDRLQIIYTRGVVALQAADDLYDYIYRDVLKTDYFNLQTMRGKLLTARGALGETESECNEFFAEAERAFQRANDFDPNHKKFDWFTSRIELSLCQSDNKTDHAAASGYLEEAADFIGMAVRMAMQLNLEKPPYFLQAMMGRYYLAEARVHPEKAAPGNAEGFFKDARHGCRASLKKTKAINRIIQRYKDMYRDLPPVIKANPRAALMHPRDGAEDVSLG